MIQTMSTDPSNRESSPPHPRQKYGASCEECRRRKLRCDRRRPQCGICQESGIRCHVAVSRALRGPKPGYIKDLQARIAALEGSIIQANQQQELTGYSDCVENMVLNDSHAPLDPFNFGEPRALKLDMPTYSYPEGSTQAHEFNAFSLTTMGIPWEDTMARTQLLPSDMLDTLPMSTLNYSSPTGELLVPNLANDFPYTSLVSPSTSRKLSTASSMDSSCWSDGYECTPLGSPGMSRKTSAVSPARSPTGSDPSGGSTSSGLAQTSLDQAYWENIHQFAPIIHQRHYLSWSQRPDKSTAQIALQYTMWTLAASTTAENTHLNVDQLYHGAVRALQAKETAGDAAGLTQSGQLELVQAHLLLSMYEIKRKDFRQGWLTAGRAFRLIQFGWFQDLVGGLNSSSLPTDWTDLEEKRRTFWLAYYLDRIISLRSDSACTFEDEPSIPLPIPDSNFQNGIPAVTVYLTESLGGTEPASEGVVSDFTESIILATICGYALSHRRQLRLEQAQCRVMDHFWSRHSQISSRLAERADLSAKCYSNETDQMDQILLFQSIMWHTVILYMHQTMNFAKKAHVDEKSPGLEYFQETSIIAQNLSILINHLLEAPCFESHPLAMIPLDMCSRLLEAWPDLAASFSNKFRSISEPVRGQIGLSAITMRSSKQIRAPKIKVKD